jgi:hypothetical protein
MAAGGIMHKEYIVITEEALGDLVKRVNIRMKSDWQPLGAPFVIQHAQGVRLPGGNIVASVCAQAMIR